MPRRQEEFLKTQGMDLHRMPDARIALAEETLSSSGALRLRATGASMLPAIAPGDMLDFRKPPCGSIAPGQVLLIRRHGRFVVHRMVGEQAGMILARGDALAANDAPVEPSDVIGVLVAQWRGDRALHAGGRHWLRRQRLARWAIRRIGIAGTLFNRLPALAVLVA